MMIKFIPDGQKKHHYHISGTLINGIDISDFPENGKFTGNNATDLAGIVDVTLVNSVPHVTLTQRCLPYQCDIVNGFSTWVASSWVDANEYDENTCYVIASSKPEGAEYVKREQGFTVAIPAQEDNDELV